MNCVLCAQHFETVLFETENYRIIAVSDEPNIPAFCRVIWNHHVAEMSDLSPSDRAEIMNAVFALEAAMRKVLHPKKMNLASLGNVVPHIHWHVIARFEEDAHYPAPVWATARRENHFRLPEDWQTAVRDELRVLLSV